MQLKPSLFDVSLKILEVGKTDCEIILARLFAMLQEETSLFSIYVFWIYDIVLNFFVNISYNLHKTVLTK